MLDVGKKYSITVFEEEEVLCGVVIERSDEKHVEVSLFHDELDQLVVGSFLLWLAAEQIGDQVYLSRAKALAVEAIDRVKEYYASEGEDSPSPTDVSDIPF